MEKNEERPDTVPDERAPEAPADAAAEAVADETKAPAEPVAAPADARGRGGSRRYLLTAAVLVFGAALFAAGFATNYLLDDDVDLETIENRLAALDQRTSQIQDTLSGAVVNADGGDEPTGNPAAANSAAADDDPFWGPEDASVVIVEFADFQCPFCARHYQETLPSIKDAYGDEVRYVYRDFPLTSIHQFAQKAAEAGQCAQEQGLFWEYHDLLFGNQDSLTVDDLKGYAEQVGADAGEFNDCLDSGKNQREVLQDAQDGRTAGVTGTPGFLINGALVSGAQPFEAFQQVIDQLLAAEE